MIKNILSIAGSDPSGGAGIQADLKTFSALGCYGMSVLSALTAQNTKGVRDVKILSTNFIKAQLEAIFEDIRIDAVKIGMAGNENSIEVIANTIERYRPAIVVLDPVMVAQSGDVLLEGGAVQALKRRLLPLATIVTPNIPEAEVLIGKDMNDPSLKNDANEKNFMGMTSEVLELGCPAVLLKGGHMDGTLSTDFLHQTGQAPITFEAQRIKTANNHGTGCTLSSALACFLAQGHEMEDAVQRAKNYITGALSGSGDLDVGGGAGPVHHFYKLWSVHDE